MKIHDTALVDKKAELGDGVEVEPYSVIGPDVRIGAGSKIGPHCTIEQYTTIGKNCRMFTGSAIGGISQDLKFRGDKSSVIIGDDNTIREYVTINRATTKGSATRIGSGNLIMAYAHVAHDCKIGDRVVIANCGTLAGYVTIEDNVIVGGLAGIHQFVRLGTLSIIGGCSKVIKHIPPYAMADGHPAKIYGINIIGLNRAGVSQKARMGLKRAFKILFNSGLSLPHALSEIENNLPHSKEIRNLTHFLKTIKTDTKRGVCR